MASCGRIVGQGKDFGYYLKGSRKTLGSLKQNTQVCVFIKKTEWRKIWRTNMLI